VPEVATILFTGGCKFPDGEEKLITFEVALSQLQQQMEQSFTQIARSTGQPSVIFFDRGILDNAAYLPKEGWEKVLAATNLTEKDVLRRYDSVLHLVTAADGAEKFYKWGNVKDDSGNDVYRKESPEMARELDQKILAVWSSHPRVGRIQNESSFSDKMQQAVACVSEQANRTLQFLSISKVFQANDASNNGTILSKTLRTCLKSIDQQKFSDETIDELLKYADVAGEEHIQYDNFIVQMAA